MGGRRKKLAALEILEGNPSKRLIQTSGIEALGEPFIPEHLMDDARGCIEVIKQSMPDGVYSALDSFHLAAFGMAWAVHKRAALEIGNPDFEWLLEGTKGTTIYNPWLKILNNQAAVMVSLGDRLGLDPKARAAIHLPNAKQQSKFAGLIGSTKSGLTALSNSSKN